MAKLIKHGDLTETQINRIDTAVYHTLEIFGDKQYLICYRFELDQSQGNAPTGNYTQTSRLHAKRNNLPRNVDIQLKRARREEEMLYGVDSEMTSTKT